MKTTISKAFLCSLILLPFLSSTVFADPCDTISQDPTWNENIKRAHEALTDKSYDKVLEISRELYNTCPRSPALNYLIGKSLLETGEHTKGVMYLQKASEYTSEFVVEPEMQRIIWYERYEAEHPERKESALNSLNDINQQLHQENTRLLQENIDLIDKDQLKNNIIMWTGVGIAGAGLLMTITGGVLGFRKDYNDKYVDITEEYKASHKDDTSERVYDINRSYVFDWAVFGAGIAMLAAGAAMTGIGAYYYIENIKEKSPLDFSIGPSSVNFRLTF